MKTTVSRVLTRAGLAATAGLIATAAFAAPASAAAPDDADVSVRFAGTTIASLSDGKFGSMTIRNDGPGAATGVTVVFDATALDGDKIFFNLSPGCVLASATFTCTFDDDQIPPPGGESDFAVPIRRKAGALPGPAGSITVTVSTDTNDPNSANNSQTANVVIGATGVDLVVVAFDVYALDGAGNPTTDPVPLGGSSRVDGFIFNFGDLAAAGIKVVVTLPEHVTFAETEPDCTYSADNRVATCNYTDVTLFPSPVPPDSDDDVLYVWWPLTVATDAPGPTALQGGSMVVSAIDILQPEVPKVRSSLPRNMRWLEPAEIPDVDPTDNNDPFAVFVAGDLPVTGAQAGLYAMSGAGLLMLGVIIVVLARRRRRAASDDASAIMG